MLTYSLKRKNDTESVDSKMLKTKNGKTMLSSKCVACASKISKFIKRKEAKGLFSSLGLETPLSKVPLFRDVLF